LPLGYIYELLKRNAEHEKKRANIYSISTARLTSVILAIANGFSGNKSECKVKIDELLPFPLNAEQHERDQETNRIYKELIKSGRVPLHVIGALNKVIDI